MPHPVSLLDRLRIERVVWLLDQRLYDLPRRSRIEKRRDVRANLLTAASDVGTGPALRQLGDSRALAVEYLSAEFGDGPRHSWVAAGIFAGTVPFLLTYVLGEAALAFGAGITAADPHATGSYDWAGIAYLQSEVTYTFADGRGTSVGGAWTPLCYLLWILGTVLAGRLWRLLPRPARRSAAATP